MTERRSFTDAEIADAKARADLVALVGKRVALKKKGRDLWGLCPWHGEKSPSFKVDPKGFWKCFGCGKGGDAITWLVEMESMTFEEAVKALRNDWVPQGIPMTRPACAPVPVDELKPNADAKAIWDKAVPAKGTAVEEYLKARGIKVPPSYWSELRFAPRLYHGMAKRSFPAMIARLSDDRGFMCIQRTYLDPREPKKADVMPNKMTLGMMRCAAVRFGQPDEMLGLAEGVESALSARELYSIPTWATLSCVRLKQIEIPKTVKVITIFGDQDAHGKAEAFEAAEVYEAKGYRAEIVFPGSHVEAADRDDFNSILTESRARRYE